MTIVKLVYGSHLYGTNTPLSDQDYKGIFLPTKREILLGKIPKSINISTKKGDCKNSSDDVDTEIYSLHYFIHLACEGETVALDMLHASESCVLEKSEIWDELITNRNKFYTKNSRAFVGYCRKQAAKYGVKGSRLNDAGKVLDYINSVYGAAFFKLKDVWNELPTGEHIRKIEDVSPHIYEVCGRKIQETASLDYAKGIIQKFYDNYGERAKLAASNEGIDWKAVSHAIRVAYEMKEVLSEGNITFPLRERDFVKKVKAGEFDYLTIVAPKLEELMDEVEVLSAKSNLPEKPDRKFWDDWLVSVVEESFNGRTPGFDPGNEGSNPSSSAKIRRE